MTMTDHGRLADESGYVAVWTVVIGGALMVAGGVVYDSADKANEARRVTMVANEAGRAAAAGPECDSRVPRGPIVYSSQMTRPTR